MGEPPCNPATQDHGPISPGGVRGARGGSEPSSAPIICGSTAVIKTQEEDRGKAPLEAKTGVSPVWTGWMLGQGQDDGEIRAFFF